MFVSCKKKKALKRKSYYVMFTTAMVYILIINFTLPQTFPKGSDNVYKKNFRVF